ncbi:hypothetical protein HYU09_00025 [Candidatus Woesearchaeota archaeon]|nr:hypothetical protein [Candidatus Woesearchaeota archaeon]
MVNKKNLAIISIFFIIFIIGIAYISVTEDDEIPDYQTPSPEKVVEQYFTAWNNKNYPDMYSTISDGFKKIEPTAKDLRAFKEYAESQHINDVRILSLKEASNDGKTAAVDYNVEFSFLDVVRRDYPFSGTFTLKYRQGDVISGWKLIHPYGENIDAS